ncbi:hypothetical protein [Caldicellulosiruptor bescii]|uniref:hypothetical protein n=1 Tax=Caldicellulosiruptor bescii TaxID=31899 RepID=UPI00211D7ABD
MTSITGMGQLRTVHVWNRLKGYFLPLDGGSSAEIMKENPNKVKFDLPAERLKAQVWCWGIIVYWVVFQQ